MKAEIKERIEDINKGIVPKGYKTSKLGVIPEDWDVKHFEDVAVINPSKENLDENEIVSFVTMSDVSDDAKLIRYQPKLYKEVSNGFTAFKDRDVLVAKITPCFENGKGALVDNLINKTGFGSTEFHVLRPKKYGDEVYIYYHTITDRFRKIGEKNMTGTAGQKRISTDFVKGFLIPYPRNDIERKKIADILSTWDKAIELKEKLIEQKKEQKKGLMQNLLTGRIRWNDGSKFSWREIKKRLEMISQGKVPEGYHKTQIGIIPLEWRVKRLKDISKRVQRENGRNDHPVLTISSLVGFLNQNERFSKVIAGENLSKYILLFKNEFAYNKGNSKTYPYGCVFRLEDYDRALVPNVYYCFEIVNGLSEFYKHYFLAGMLNKPLSRVINTGVRNDGLLNLNVDDFFSLPIIVPPLVEQERIANILTTADKEIQQLERELEALKQQKKGLMQLLLTGKVRVKC